MNFTHFIDFRTFLNSIKKCKNDRIFTIAGRFDVYLSFASNKYENFTG
jgi:hypothetical protein